jgi:hypothetical protein
MLSVTKKHFMLSVTNKHFMLSVTNKPFKLECHYVERHHAECRGAVQTLLLMFMVIYGEWFSNKHQLVILLA